MRMGVVLFSSADVSNLNASPENVATTGNLIDYRWGDNTAMARDNYLSVVDYVMCIYAK